jgi:hypothetical protein
MSKEWFATRAWDVPQGSCGDCAYWAYLGNRKGECTAHDDHQHEAVVSLIIRRLDDNGISFTPLPADERKCYCANLLTPADFSCSAWVENPAMTGKGAG